MGVKKNGQKYQALFGDVYLGSFPTAEEAALCYARYWGIGVVFYTRKGSFLYKNS